MRAQNPNPPPPAGRRSVPPPSLFSKPDDDLFQPFKLQLEEDKQPLSAPRDSSRESLRRSTLRQRS